MIDPKDVVDKLQKQPYQTRVRILWITVVVVAAALIVLWVFGLKSTFSNFNGKSLVDMPTAKVASETTDMKLVAIESVEQTNSALKIYFNVNNTTGDILNFSQISDITLNSGGTDANPTQMTDRQGQPFVQKVLSHTQNFGILVFPRTQDTAGTLTFDQMSFEQSASNIFQQQLNLDFQALKKTTNLRH